MARRGVQSCTLGLFLLALLPRSLAPALLYGGAACLAFTSATVVNALTAAASLQCDEGVQAESGKPNEPPHPALAKGRALGEFRSAGQLGRAIGPILGEAALRSNSTLGSHYIQHVHPTGLSGRLSHMVFAAL